MTDTQTAVNEFSLARHNGHVTLTSPVTGKHRVFEIRTVKRGEWKDRRIVALKENMEVGLTSYRAFGEVVGEKVKVWSKYRGTEGQKSLWERYADLLERPAYWAGRMVRYQVEARCRRCNRLLLDPESLTRGLGPECAKKI